MTKEEKMYLDHLKKEAEMDLKNLLTRLNILFACDTALKDIRVVDITADKQRAREHGCINTDQLWKRLLPAHKCYW